MGHSQKSRCALIPLAYPTRRDLCQDQALDREQAAGNHPRQGRQAQTRRADLAGIPRPASAPRRPLNAAFGNCCQMARSSRVTVSHPNRNMYRPGSVTRPACAHVILLTANHFPFAFSPDSSARFAPSKDQFLSARKKSGRSRDSSLAGKPVSGSGIL
jgi:hypothetical protein